MQGKSRLIDSLRFPMAVLVVAAHSDIKGNMFSQSISHVLAHVAVPIFFMISGFLFFKGIETWKWDKWKHKIVSRVNTLLIPYVIWITLYLAIHLTIPSLSDYWCANQWNLDRLDIWGNPNISSSPALVPMWFIRDLIVCISITPIIYFFFHKPKGLCDYVKIVVSSTIVLLLYLSQTSLCIPGVSSFSIFYFCFGALLSLNGFELKRTTHVLISIIAFLLFVIEIIYDGHNTIIGNYIYPFYVLAAVLAVIGLFNCLVTSNNVWQKLLVNFLEKNADTSFFIFASHIFILPYVAVVLNKVNEKTGINSLLGETVATSCVYMLKIFITTTICVMLYRILQKYLPKLLKLICGK
ncbi:acyltransferase family protein [Bacteroides congonensis]